MLVLYKPLVYLCLFLPESIGKSKKKKKVMNALSLVYLTGVLADTPPWMLSFAQSHILRSLCLMWFEMEQARITKV